MSSFLRDKELNQYRDLVQAPGTFEEGFTWRTVLGTLFVGIVMLPAAMYMHLMIGGASLGPAAEWVTVILMLEIAKRARSFLKPAELLILQGMIFAFVGGGPVESFFWRQYIVQSDAARSFGLDNAFPDWYAPTSQEVLDERNFFHAAWAVPLLLVFISMVVARFDSLILGYGLFRMASDVEKLPFPMAPMKASGLLALCEDTTAKDGWRWRCFSIASAIGMFFGLVYIAVPTITSTFLPEPFRILPIPWLDTTTSTQEILPATATGIAFDLGPFFAGMAMPFFGVLGGLIGVVVTFIANPLLYQHEILRTWKPGMGTVETLFANNVDFYLSFGIGLSLAVAVIGLYQTFSKAAKAAGATLDQPAAKAVLPSSTHGVARGDIRTPIVILTYGASIVFYILISGILLKWNFGPSMSLLWILLFFSLVYTPFISYVTARLEGLAGMAIGFPFVKEAAFILSGYKGIECWLLPIAWHHNYGVDIVQYRVAELLGCSFRSIWKSSVLLLPTIFIFSLIFGQFIWGMGTIPSAQYPFANEMWDLNARNQCLVWSSTNEGYSLFMDALNGWYIAAGSILGLVFYFGLAAFGLPILLIYGVINGLGQSIPQTTFTAVAGALFGRFVMARVYGPDRWRQYAVVLAAGFSCGTGLVMMFSTGVKFLSSAVIQKLY